MKSSLIMPPKIARWLTAGVTLSLLILWPMPTFCSGYVFSKPFAGWVVAGIIWLLWRDEPHPGGGVRGCMFSLDKGAPTPPVNGYQRLSTPTTRIIVAITKQWKTAAEKDRK